MYDELCSYSHSWTLNRDVLYNSEHCKDSKILKNRDKLYGNQAMLVYMIGKGEIVLDKFVGYSHNELLELFPNLSLRIYPGFSWGWQWYKLSNKLCKFSNFQSWLWGSGLPHHLINDLLPILPLLTRFHQRK